MLHLHYAPGNASLIVHLVLEEIRAPFELKLVDRAQSAHKSPAYLALNPNGLIPVLVDDESGGASGAPLVLYETAAICLHLADTHPQAGLAPALGTPERAQMYKWLIWLTNTMQAMLIHYFYPDRMVAPGNTEGTEQVKALARAKVGGHLAQIDAQLASHGGPWLLGAQYTIADPLCFMLCRWTRGFSTKPARDYEHIGPYMKRVFDRPAVQRAVATEKLPQPVY